MYNRIRWIVGVLLLLVLPVAAQGAPSQIDAALNDLSSRLGITIRVDNQTLSSWQWGQETFNDTSLGCPAEGEMYAQVITPGYTFTLEYAGIVYEYHVSADSTIVRLCGQRSSDAPTEEAPLEEQYSNPLCPPPTAESGAYPRSYVAPNIPATGTLFVNRLRQSPDTDAAIITEIPNGAVFTVVNGPACDEEGIVWWQIDYDGLSGWTAEAMGNERYIMPQEPNPLPQRSTITADNALQLSLLSVIEANFGLEMAWSTNGLLAVPGGIGMNGAFIYTMADLSQPFVIEQDVTVTALDFIPNNQQLLVGTLTGGVHIWNIATTVDTPFVESLFLQTHVSDIQAVVSHPSQMIFASAGYNAQTHVNVDRTNAIVVANYETVAQDAILAGHSNPVVDLVFSPDGTKLAALEGINTGGSLYLWDVASRTPTIAASAGFTAIDYSPNGQFIAGGQSNGSIVLLDASSLQVVTTFTGHLREITGVSFSPDSGLLASVSADGTLRLWNTQSDANIAVVDVTERGVDHVAFSPDGTLIAVSYAPRTITLFGVAQP